MWKKRSILLLFALTIACSSTLYGCDGMKTPTESGADASEENSGETSGEDKDSGGADKTDSNGKEKSEDAKGGLSAEECNALWKEYLGQQTLCQINKKFEISDSLEVQNAPSGLAAAVQNDFDGDAQNELVTFTFDKNSTDGDDIRIDLLEIEGGAVKVSDSKYLTEILDISDKQQAVTNSIYFSRANSMEIATSSYQGNLYFGSLLTRECYFYAGETYPYVKSFNVFTIENHEITPCTIASTDMEWATVAYPLDETVIYSKLLPPSIRETQELGSCSVDEEQSPYPESAQRVKDEVDAMTIRQGKSNLYTNLFSAFEAGFHVVGGTCSSAEATYSLLLNEFGLDIAYDSQEELQERSSEECSAQFVAKGDAQVTPIVKISLLKKYHYQSMEYEEYLNKLTLTSDLNEILGDENLFTETFENEDALFEDILRYPEYHHDIWDTFDSMNLMQCIMDLDQDGKKELLIEGTNDSDYKSVGVVKADGSFYFLSDAGMNTEYFSNGFIRGNSMNSVFGYTYLNTTNGETWSAQLESGQSSVRILENGDGSQVLKGTQADEKEKTMYSADTVTPNFQNYYVWQPEQNLQNFTSVSKTDSAAANWKSAYFSILDEFQNSLDYKMDGVTWKYALLYIDDDDVPELYVTCESMDFGSAMYSYSDQKVTRILTSPAVRDNGFMGYIEHTGQFVTLTHGGSMHYEYDVYQLKKGQAEIVHKLRCDENAEHLYDIDGEEFSKEAFDARYQTYQSQYTEVTYMTRDEIEHTLNQ